MFAVPWRLNSKIFNHRILFMVMLRVLRPIRANRRTLPQAHRLVACAFTPLLALSMSLLKKSPILIPFASSSSVAAPCGCPIWTRTHTPLAAAMHSIHRHSLAPRHARLSPPPAAPRRSLPLVVRAGAGVARSARRAHSPPDWPKPDDGGAGARACSWC
jgi:hypothetical protein